MKKIIQIPIPIIKIKLQQNSSEKQKQESEPHDRQVSIINELFLGNGMTMMSEQHLLYSSLISTKISNYKRQDVANHIFDLNWFITSEEVLELLVASRLKCYYCRSKCAVQYTEPRFSGQWTLDRLSNDQGHNRQNVVVSCLKCNLHRGVKNSNRYKLGKQMKFTKSHTTNNNDDNDDDDDDGDGDDDDTDTTDTDRSKNGANGAIILLS